MDERDHKAMNEEFNPPLQQYHGVRSLPCVVRSLPSDDFLKKLFQNNSDCYADTWSQDGLGSPMVEGEVIQAMTVEQFIKVVKSIWQ
jgi:hypothetical protein